ncbi:hypothetical protein P3X46_000371 [Hevea brasiliensis]|uniref:Uncharacterized protein n=1 Tax=Hevea brasiliensis TaxID=3981 RepID=A0ABQ9N9U3_HEVBR|nr:uncharacterized protein LOC131178619 [Hevea brasiliensis]KAJ9189029.1 hypothetical protein P3X46_000371 [Hevea brasiliensis]
MALAFIYSLQNLWPLSIFKFDDLRASNGLVSKLSIPENIKRFVYAVRDPESQSVIYILSVQNLSERSAIDAECLIREIRPEAVVVQVSSSALCQIQSEEGELGNNIEEPVPTSFFGVIKRCFIDKISKDKYENVAGKLVLKEIFGIGFYGHIMAAKRVAREVGSSFLLLETPLVQTSVVDDSSSEVDTESVVRGLVSSLIPQKLGSAVSSSSGKFCLTDEIQFQMVKLLSPYMEVSMQKLRPSSSVSEAGSKEIHPGSSYLLPPFAQSVYPLLSDLHDIFIDLPSIGRALASSQKMLYGVSRGEIVDAQIISEVYTFRIAVEGLRIALNSAGRLPIKSLGKPNKNKVEFSELPVEDKLHALLAQALRTQTRKLKTIVALVDASNLAGLRKHWDTSVPPEIKELVGELATTFELDEDFSNQTDKKSLFSSKSVMAVGAGATAVLGASSLSKVVPTSTFFKVVTFKLPASLNFVLTQTQKTMAIALSKTLGPKVVAPGLANSGANVTSVLKAAASAEKIRTVAHSIIASVEKTSFSAMRTAFYEIMRKRQVQPIGFLPWATFGCSIATCSALLTYGDGIECAAESVPAAPSIASLGRGIQNLHQVSREVGQKDGTRIQKAIESLMYSLTKVKIQ